ncbi:hypothetical protein EVAR_79460_1 [Eumeta japonica]|uniref:Uncharacterized protein n=1 Tax=Eumeta variegata TaxID=151549 RepID=A0A4C1UF02_EUMVA|nr:hypothetical protein EVAR_79460_1 [Eumeta japonica]
MRLEPVSNDRPSDIKIITNWINVSFVLEEINTSALNKIPNDIDSTKNIDNAIDSLTSHIKTVVEKNSRNVPANSDCRELLADICQCQKRGPASRKHYPTPTNRSYARALQRTVKAYFREVRNNNWSSLMKEITPTHKAYWQVAKPLRSNDYEPIPAYRNPDNTLAFYDRDKAECLADSIKRNAHTSTLHTTLHMYTALRRKFDRNSFPRRFGSSYIRRA